MAQGRPLKVRLRSAKRRRPGSTRWLTRQLNDRFVQRARAEGYRSRSAYKLLELDHTFRLLAAGRRVLDLGSAPGGWAQVALARGCRVVGVDLLEMAPLEGAVLLQGNAFDPALVARLLDALGGPADVLLSDLAPSSSGQRAVDRLRAEAAAEEVLALLPRLLATSGSAVIKLMRGAEGALAHQARRRFEKTKLARPEATRRESSEIYLVGLRHVGAPASGDDAS